MNAEPAKYSRLYGRPARETSAGLLEPMPAQLFLRAIAEAMEIARKMPATASAMLRVEKPVTPEMRGSKSTTVSAAAQ
jgi:hypothetical protein